MCGKFICRTDGWTDRQTECKPNLKPPSTLSVGDYLYESDMSTMTLGLKIVIKLIFTDSNANLFLPLYWTSVVSSTCYHLVFYQPCIDNDGILELHRCY